MNYQFEPPDTLRGMQRLSEEREQWDSNFELQSAPNKSDDRRSNRRRLTGLTLFAVVATTLLVVAGIVQISYMHNQASSLEKLAQSISRMTTDLQQIQTRLTLFGSRTGGRETDFLPETGQTVFPTAQPEVKTEASGHVRNVARDFEDVIGALIDITTRQNEQINSTGRLLDVSEWTKRATADIANTVSVESQLLLTQGEVLGNLTLAIEVIFKTTETQVNDSRTVRNRMDTLDDKLTELRTEIISLSTHQGTHNSRLTDMELIVDDVLESVSNMSTVQQFDMSQVLDSTARLATDLLTANNGVTELRQHTHDIKNDLGHLNAKGDNVLAHTTNWTSMVSDIMTQADNITAMGLRIDAKQYEVASILTGQESALTSLRGSLNELSSSADVQTDSLLNLTSVVSTLSGNGASVSDAINGLNIRVIQLVTTTNSLQTTMHNLTTTSDGFDSKLEHILAGTNTSAGMAIEINSSTSAMAEIVQSVSGLRRRLENVTVALFAPPPTTTSTADIFDGSANGLGYFADYLSERFHRTLTETSLSVGVFIGNRHLRKCLSVRSSDNKIQVRNCQYGNTNSDQIWTMDSTGRLHSRPTDKCLDVAGLRSQIDGKQLYSFTCSAQDDHFWQLEYTDCGSYVQFKNRDTGKCVGVVESSGLVQQFTCHSSCNVANSKQFWVLIPV